RMRTYWNVRKGQARSAGHRTRLSQARACGCDVREDVGNRPPLKCGSRFRAPFHQLVRVNTRTLATVCSSEAMIGCGGEDEIFVHGRVRESVTTTDAVFPHNPPPPHPMGVLI